MKLHMDHDVGLSHGTVISQVRSFVRAPVDCLCSWFRLSNMGADQLGHLHGVMGSWGPITSQVRCCVLPACSAGFNGLTEGSTKAGGRLRSLRNTTPATIDMGYVMSLLRGKLV